MSNTTRSTGRAPVRLSLVSLLLVTLLPIILLLAACDAEPPGPQPSESLSDAAADDPLTHWKKHLDPNYVCPMHPQIIRNEPGTCPICGMDLVQKIIDARAIPRTAAKGRVARPLGGCGTNHPGAQSGDEKSCCPLEARVTAHDAA